jgi:HEAT repeat protein
MNIARQNAPWAIWWKTLLVAGLYLLATRFFYAYLSSGVFKSATDTDVNILALACSFLGIQFLVLAILIVVLFLRKAFGEIKVRQIQITYPLIREKIAGFVMGDDDCSELLTLQKKHPVDVEECFMEFLDSMIGEGRERISQLAEVLGLIDSWQRRYQSRNPKTREAAISRLGQLSEIDINAPLLAALNDNEETIRTQACRALIRSQKPEHIETAFSFLMTQSLLVRSLLIEELKPYSLMLAERKIPEYLGSEDSQQVILTLETINAWRNTLPLPNTYQLLQHKSAEVRAKALYALSYISTGDQFERYIINAFADTNYSVRIAALAAAARLKIVAAVPQLTICLRDENHEVVRAAAFALAQLGANGLEVLEQELFSLSYQSAATVLEIIERVNIGRSDYF